MRLVLAASLSIAALASAPPAHAADGPLVVQASVPPTVLFGDELTTRVTVSANPDEVDTSSIRVTAPLAPMTQLAPTRVSRTREGALDVVTFDVTAACLDQRCVAAAGPRVLELPRVRVSATATDGSELTDSAAWPKLTVRGRVPATVRDSTGQFRTDLEPPPATYRASPDRSSVLLFVAALVLAGGAVALAARRIFRLVRRRHEIPLTELERALVLVRQSEQRPPADRRRAVGLLARILGTDERPLAEDASTLAWSAPEPTPDSVSTLVDDVGRTVGVR